LDVDASGPPAPATEPVALGLTTDELQRMARLYAPMTTTRAPNYLALLYAAALWMILLARSDAHQFKLGDVTVDLQEITTNVDLYFSAMRYNRAANEWDVEVTVSNKASQVFSGPVVLLVDSFSGTSGPLRPDGVSTNQAFYDLSERLSGSVLLPGTKSGTRMIGLGFWVTSGRS
jgi:hypothetical protein